MAKSPEETMQTMVAQLEAKTGKSLADWVALVRGYGAVKHGEAVGRLKSEHGLGHGYANLVVHKAGEAAAGGPAAGDDLVAAQYAGAKTGLRPIYDAIVAAVAGFGPDLEVSPKKTCVSLRRSKQFALVQPSTATRVDLGIQLKGVAPAGRLEASGSFNQMVSHRVRLAAPAEVDAEVVGWLRRAYDAA